MTVNPINQGGFESALDPDNAIPSNPGTIWDIGIRYDLPGGVVAQNNFQYRQTLAFEAGKNVALELTRAFVEYANNPWVHIRGNQASSVETVCAIVQNISDNTGLTQVFTLSDYPGTGGADMLSAQATHRVIYQSANGNIKHRKSVYFGGLDEAKFREGAVEITAFSNFRSFIDDSYTLQVLVGDPGELTDAFVLLYGEDEGTWIDAAAGYVTSFTSRLKGRQTRVC